MWPDSPHRVFTATFGLDLSILEREKRFYDEAWKGVRVRQITGKIMIPGVKSIKRKRLLICSCGSGKEPVRGAMLGAETYAFDISKTAVENATHMAEHNNVTVKACVTDFHRMSFQDNYFDILYGSAILHHVDCSIAGREIYRVLKPGGIAFFRENSDGNPFLRHLRRLLFGKPGGHQRRQFFFIKRTGTSDEYPLTVDEIKELSRIFNGNVRVIYDDFFFFALLNRLVFRNPNIGKLLRSLDSNIGKILPFMKRYSFHQQILLTKGYEGDVSMKL